MAQLTLRDLATNEEIIVPPEGFVFGRTGGDADIQIEDNSISRRQARVSNRQGTWVLEVMVVPPGQRLPRPQALQEGQTFFIGQSEFEVVAVEGDEGEEPAKTVAPSRGKPGPAPAPAAPAKKPAAAAPAARSAPPPAAAKKPAAKPAARPADDEDAAADAALEGGAKDGIGALLAGVPKGIAYYTVNIPKMLVNPLGTVRRTIEEQPSPPIGKIGLIGYAIPAQVATAGLGAIGGAIAALIAGGGVGGAIAAIVGGVIAMVIGAVVGIITGFIFHPVLKWIIEKLKGESDERSRSNYFLQVMTVSIILGVPSALNVILSSIRWVNLLGPVVGLAGSLIMAYVSYQWMVHFKVIHWIPKLILLGGALSVLGTVFSTFGILMADIRGVGSVSSASSADIEAAQAAALAASDEAMKNADSNTKDALAKAQAMQKAAMEAAAKGGKAAKEAQEAAMKMQEAAAKQAKEAQEAAEKATDDARDSARAAAQDKAGRGAPPAAHDDAPSGDSGDDAAAPSGGFSSYAHRREAIEKRLQADPTVLANDGDLQKLYGNYAEAAYKVEQDFQKKVGKDPERTHLYEHLRDAELYKRTGGMVEKLSNKLGVH